MKLRITNINKFVCLDNRYKIFDEMKIHGESDESFFYYSNYSNKVLYRLTLLSCIKALGAWMKIKIRKNKQNEIRKKSWRDGIMKKKLKKVFAFAVACVMAMSVAACGGSSDNAGTQNSDNGSGTEGGTFLIGGIGPLTGGAAVYGEAVRNGAQIAIDEINTAGGVNGMTLAMNFQDDEHDAEKAVNAYNTLKDRGMKVLMGTVTSDPCIAVVEKTAEDNMFQITPSGSAMDCIRYDNAFRVCFNDPEQGAASAQYIGESGLAEKVAIIYDSSDTYSSGIYETFVMEAANQGFEIVETQAFTADSKTDFSVQLQKIQEAAPDLVFLPIYYEEAALILKQADRVNLSVQFFGCDGLDGVIGQLGDDVALAEGAMLLTPFVADAQDELTQRFVSTYESLYGITPNQFAADAYDAIYAIKAALEFAGISDPNMSVSDICEAMKAAMLEIEVPGLTGTMTWSADGECSKEPKAMVISGGVYTAINN